MYIYTIAVSSTEVCGHGEKRLCQDHTDADYLKAE